MDLRAFISQLEREKQIINVEGADCNLEIGALTELTNEKKGHALLFSAIRGYPPGHRIITNFISTPTRLAITFGLPTDISNIELVRAIKERFKQLKPIPPVYVERGPVLENIYGAEDIDLLRFPAPKWHADDGGRYLGTGDMVIMKDPKGNWVNAGTYRVQLHDKDTLGLYIDPGHHGRLIRESYWAEGKSCPVAVVFGAHPLILLSSFLAFPWGTEEFGIAGSLLGEPLPLITGEYTGLPIPAWAELVIEGECPPPEVESRQEGPFGEWPGYYASGARSEPVIKVKRVMHRNDPIITGAPPLCPPSSTAATNITRASNIWHGIELQGIPGVQGVWNMRAGGSRFLTVISIEQKYAGHAKQAALAAMSGSEGGNYGRFVIVVDEDIDPSNEEDVLWAMATRCDPATAMEVVTGCWSTPLDPTMSPEKRARGELTNSRAIVLACRPYHWRKDFPRVSRASNELRAETMKKWAHLFPYLCPGKTIGP